MNHRSTHRSGGAALVAALVMAIVGVGAEAARAEDPPACYDATMQSLTGPDGADVTIRVEAVAPGCAAPDALKKLQLKVFDLDGSLARTRNLTDVATTTGTATVELGKVARGQRVAAVVLVQSAPDRTYVVRDETKTLLRPDLAVASVTAPRRILSGREFAVEVEITERNRDVGAAATVTVAAGTVVVATSPVELAAGAAKKLTFSVKLQPPGAAKLDVTIADAAPRETTTANNVGHATVEVTEFEIDAATVLVPNVAGYGGQFNHHVYADLSRQVGVTPENVVQMERKMVELRPQFSRIFFNPSAFTFPDRMASFIRTVQLAQRTGTEINVTWQGGTFDVKSGNIPKFANVLIDLVANRGITNLRWLTLQNEPNRTRLTPEEYEQRYRTLDPYIFAIRGQVRYMGGDLVRGPDTGPPNQQLWFDYMATHMADILDSYSIHVFWDYWDTQKLQARLTEVRAIVDNLPESGRKPLYVSEYGVRGLRTFNGLRADPGFWQDGTPIARTNISAFQHAWFDLLSARLGYLGTSKWDSYFGKYDNGTQAYYMIGGPQDGWPLYPLYHLVELMTGTVKPGWRVVGLDSVPDTSRLLTAYAGPAGDWTLFGLDTAGAQLNAASQTGVSYTIGGLPPSRALRLVVWNQAGDGMPGATSDVEVDAAGVANVTVPQHGVFALTTMPVE